MRRALFAILILALPSTVAVVVFYFTTKKIPTNRDAIGHVTTVAGSGQPGTENGNALEASFSDPFGIAIDRKGNLIVADAGRSNLIRRVNTLGKVETIAGSSEGFGDGNALSASFNTPSGLCINRNGEVIIADTSNNRIRKLSTDGKVTTLAGSGSTGFKDGPSDQAEFDGPIGVAVDRRGNVFVADAYNDAIRKIATDGTVTTLAGTGSPGFKDGPGEAAQFDTPCGVAVDEQQNLFVADTGNRAVRKITARGEVITIAAASTNSDAIGAKLERPAGIVATHDGFLFVTDMGGGRIIRITPEGVVNYYAGIATGYGDGIGRQARFNGPTGIAIDRQGVIYIADTQNFSIREIAPAERARQATPVIEPFAVQPGEGASLSPSPPRPVLNRSTIGVGGSFPWPLSPQDHWHEVAGVVGEARGAPGGVALDHLHSGLDVSGHAGEAALSVFDEKVSSPLPNWDFDGPGEGIQVGFFSYIHIRVGRDPNGQIGVAEKFKPRTDPEGRLIGVRVRRGTRFRPGDFMGSLNKLNHVHLNLGPWNAEVNPLALPFADFKDSVPPTIEAIEIFSTTEWLADGNAQGHAEAFKEKRNGNLIVSGGVAIVVTAYDRADGNAPARKLGLFRVGYQLVNGDGTPVKGFEAPLMNLEFDRVPPGPEAVFRTYAAGSGISAYGTPTRFRYIVTNKIRNGEAYSGQLDTSLLAPGDYVVKIIAEDYAGNRAMGKSTELPIRIVNSAQAAGSR